MIAAAPVLLRVRVRTNECVLGYQINVGPFALTSEPLRRVKVCTVMMPVWIEVSENIHKLPNFCTHFMPLRRSKGPS